MKTAKRTITGIMATLAMLAAVSAWAGELTPPGAPAPTMKTLDQVEPRTPISSPGYAVTESGSYYLTTNLAVQGSDNGIDVHASDVSIDLNGFTISGASALANGVRLHAVENVVVENGTIRDCYFNGIYAYSASNCVFRNLRVMGNARNSTDYAGIIGGEYCAIENCVFKNNNGSGVKAYAGSKICGNCMEGNTDAGLYLTGTGSLVDNNIVKANGDNYNLTVGNQLNLLLCEIPETLDWPCSVKLAGTLSTSLTGIHGITVNANEVTIDMNGHTLIGPGAFSGNGIFQNNSYRNLTVLNGKAVEWRGTHRAGVQIYGKGNHLSGLQAGTNYYGIVAGDGNTLQNCTAYDNVNSGISANFGNTIENCTAYDNGGIGIQVFFGNTLQNCTAYGNGEDGINASDGNTLQNCTAYGNDDNGIYAISGCTVRRCTAQDNKGDGIQVSTDCTVADNTCDNNGYVGDGAGIHATSVDNRIEDNNITDNDRGIDVDSTGNIIVRNTAAGNTLNWDVAAGNACLVVQATTGGAISGDSGGSGLGSTNPNANFTY